MTRHFFRFSRYEKKRTVPLLPLLLIKATVYDTNMDGGKP